MYKFRSASLLAAAVALMLVALSGPVAAGSPFIEDYQDKGRAGIAGNGDCTFDPGTGDESCFWVDVFAQTGWIKEGGVRHKGGTVCIFMSEFEYDASEDLVTDVISEGCGSASVAVAKDLSTASADGTIELDVCNYDSETDACIPDGTRDVDVDLEWDAEGPLFSNRGTYTETFGGCTYKERFRGTFKPAEVEGTIAGHDLFGEVAKGAAKRSFRCH